MSASSHSAWCRPSYAPAQPTKQCEPSSVTCDTQHSSISSDPTTCQDTVTNPDSIDIGAIGIAAPAPAYSYSGSQSARVSGVKRYGAKGSLIDPSVSIDDNVISPVGYSSLPLHLRRWNNKNKLSCLAKPSYLCDLPRWPNHEFMNHKGDILTWKPKTAFYNTKEGDLLIDTVRKEMHLTSKPIDNTQNKSSVQDNRQRAYHADCILPNDIATADVSVHAHYRAYPTQEFRFTGRFASTIYAPKHEMKAHPTPLQVQTRFNLGKNVRTKQSISNYNHGLPFLARHITG